MRLARNRGNRGPQEGAASMGKADGDELLDADVPAAVVCARCGDAECSGCFFEQTRSGVMAIVPWERPGAPFFMRLWSTARATARDPERFFESLPDGPVGPALRFAVLCELIATVAMALTGVIPLAIFAPGWATHMLLEASGPASRLAVVGLPMLAALLVVAHVMHGWALDRGARRSGARGAATRALRFGLYSAGWDLVIGPFGAVVMAVREGASAALSLAGASIGLPTRSASAFLRGAYGLQGDAARPAMRAGYFAAVAVSLAGAFFVVAVTISALLL
jgi:hypothetical protein